MHVVARPCIAQATDDGERQKPIEVEVLPDVDVHVPVNWRSRRRGTLGVDAQEAEGEEAASSRLCLPSLVRSRCLAVLLV